MFTLNRNRLIRACLCVGLLGASAVAVPALAQDSNHGMPSAAMAKPMMRMKEAMKDDASKMQMTKDLAKTMVMHRMAMQMCMDGKCQAAMTDDVDMAKLMQDAKAMAADPDKMKMMHDAITNDPEAMKQVMMMTMAQSAMMKDKMSMDPGMKKMDEPGMKMDKMK